MTNVKKFENVWTVEEDHLILVNSDLTVKKLTELIPNRSFEAIKKRRQKIRKNMLDLPFSVPVITGATNYKPVVGDAHEWKDVTDESLEIDSELEEILEDANTKIDLDEVAQKAIEAFENKTSQEDHKETPQKSNVPISSVRHRQK
jgi:hypothetical protein